MKNLAQQDVHLSLCENRFDNHLIGEVFADGHLGATNRTNQIATMGQFADLKLFAETEVSKAVTAGAVEHPNLNIASHARLIEGHGAVAFEVLSEIGLHLGEISLIETDLQQENGQKIPDLSGKRPEKLI